MKKSDVEKLYKALGKNLHLLNIYFGDNVHGENAVIPYATAREIFSLLKSMQASNSIIWEDEESQND